MKHREARKVVNSRQGIRHYMPALNDLAHKLYVGCFLLFIFAPIVVTVLYAFNSSRYFVWPIQGFSLEWFRQAWHNRLLIEAFTNSVIIALATTALCTAIGTLMSFGLVRFRFRGRGFLNILVLLPVVTYGIVSSISLLLFFDMVHFQRGIGATILGHTTFLFPFAVIIINGRLANFDTSLEEAAMDLGARPVRVFFDITLPLIMPAIVAGALLVFTLSFDDFILSFFLIGNTNTLPVYIFGLIRYFMTPAVNAAATALIGVTMIFVVLISFFFKEIRTIWG
jgi:spermidine/putrescine transport system permease protein